MVTVICGGLFDSETLSTESSQEGEFVVRPFKALSIQMSKQHMT